MNAGAILRELGLSQKQAASKWRTPTGLAKILGITAGSTPMPRYRALSQAAAQISAMSSKAVPPVRGPQAVGVRPFQVDPGLPQLLSHAGQPTRLSTTPSFTYPGAKSPEHIYRAVSAADPFRGGYSKSWVHGTPDVSQLSINYGHNLINGVRQPVGSLNAFVARSPSYKLLSQHSVAPQQRYVGDYQLERGRNGLTWQDGQKILRLRDGGPVARARAEYLANRKMGPRQAADMGDQQNMASSRRVTAYETPLTREQNKLENYQLLADGRPGAAVALPLPASSAVTGILRTLLQPVGSLRLPRNLPLPTAPIGMSRLAAIRATAANPEIRSDLWQGLRHTAAKRGRTAGGLAIGAAAGTAGSLGYYGQQQQAADSESRYLDMRQQQLAESRRLSSQIGQ